MPKSITQLVALIALLHLCNGCLTIGPEHGDCAPYVYTITGRLVDDETGKPLSCVPVSVSMSDESLGATVLNDSLNTGKVPKSNDDGEFETVFIIGRDPSYEMRLFGIIPVGETGCGGMPFKVAAITLAAHNPTEGWRQKECSVASSQWISDSMKTTIDLGDVRLPPRLMKRNKND